jgi:Fic family protein
MRYIHEIEGWPALVWDDRALSPLLARTRHQQGRLIGRMESLGFSSRSEAHLTTLTADVVKSSAIEGEILHPEQVRSSIARRLGMDQAGLLPAGRDVEGVVEMMLDATQHCRQPLTAERLFNWHGSLFPTGRSGMRKIAVGRWRSAESGPMQVVSGSIGKERMHFEAPAAEKLEREMELFLDWLEAPATMRLDPVLATGLAHFWFVTIHPFEDGNGRIARAIADKMLTKADGSVQRFYSMSSQIEAERKDYYAALELNQRGGLDVTHWLHWFLECLGRAIHGAEETLSGTLKKAAVWQRVNQNPVNERQRKVLNRLLDGFEGNLTSSKYAKLAKCSEDTALRDIHALVGQGILLKNAGGGRSTSYSIAEPEDGLHPEL